MKQTCRLDGLHRAMEGRGRCPFAFALLEEAVQILQGLSRLQCDEEELALAVVGIAQFDRLLTCLERGHVVAAGVGGDDCIRLGQIAVGVPVQIERLQHAERDMRLALGGREEAEEDVGARIELTRETKLLSRREHWYAPHVGEPLRGILVARRKNGLHVIERLALIETSECVLVKLLADVRDVERDDATLGLVGHDERVLVALHVDRVRITPASAATGSGNDQEHQQQTADSHDPFPLVGALPLRHVTWDLVLGTRGSGVGSCPFRSLAQRSIGRAA